MPIMLIYGEDTYSRQRVLAKARQTLIDPSFASLAHKQLESPSVQQVLETINAAFLCFGCHIVIEIKEFGWLSKSAAGEERSLQSLKDSLIELAPDRTVIFINDKMDRKVAFAKWLTSQKMVQIQECKVLEFWKTEEAAQRLLAEAREQEINLTPSAATLLIESFGVEMAPLVGELQKLAIYAGHRPVTPQDVEKMCGSSQNVFKMLSAWLRATNLPHTNNPHPRIQVFKTLEELLLRQHPVQLFALINTYIDNLFKLRLWHSLGVSQAEMAERLKKHPFKVKKDLEESASVSFERLKLLKEKILTLEYAMKSGQLNDRLALEILMST